MSQFTEVALRLLESMSLRAGVQEWLDDEARQKMIDAALDMAEQISFAAQGFDAMATNKLLWTLGNSLLFADHATDFNYPTDPLAANNMIRSSPTPINVQMNFSVIAAGAAWQSAKTGSLAITGSSIVREWILSACMESTATPAGTGGFDFYWNPTPNATAGDGNSGGASGTDSSFTVTAAAIAQLIPIGRLPARANVTNKKYDIGRLILPALYGSLVMVNNTSVAMVADADADQCYAILEEFYPDMQAAA